MALTCVPLALRVAAFRALEWSAVTRQRLRGGVTTAPIADPEVRAPRSLWVFVSTIGELNAIEPFMKRLLDELGQPPLTLISDRLNYRDAYRARYPQAQLVTLQGSTAEAQALAARHPPLMLLVAEIPCRLHDAPCRFSFATLAAARRAGAPTVLVNGWLYGYAPPSRMDQIENDLFARDYVRGFDLMMVQTEDIRRRLVAAGAAPTQVAVTGNIKFDSMLPAFSGAANSPLHHALLQRAPAPIIVAGSVTEMSEQEAVLAAFAQVRSVYPSALLVLAPRHPENQASMRMLHSLLQQAGLSYRLRSEHDPQAFVAGSVAVLDTMGELRGCYAAATLAFVGRDHSVLEPLAFGKPVYVGPGWESTYPSYPVYQQLLGAKALLAPDPLQGMGEAWARHLQGQAAQPGHDAQHIHAILARARGAAGRSMTALLASSAWEQLAAHGNGFTAAPE